MTHLDTSMILKSRMYAQGEYISMFQTASLLTHGQIATTEWPTSKLHIAAIATSDREPQLLLAVIHTAQLAARRCVHEIESAPLANF